MSDEQDKFKLDVEALKRASDRLEMALLKDDPVAASAWAVHLIFDHYLIWVKERNTYVVNGGQLGAEAFEAKINELIGKVIQSQRSIQ